MPRGDIYSSVVQQLLWGYSYSMTNKGNNLQCIFQASFLFDSDTVREQQAAQRSKKAWTADALCKSGCRIGKVLWGRGRAAWQSFHIPPGGETRSEFWVHLAVTALFGLDWKEVGNLYRKQTVKRQHGVFFIPKSFIFRCVIAFFFFWRAASWNIDFLLSLRSSASLLQLQTPCGSATSPLGFGVLQINKKYAETCSFWCYLLALRFGNFLLYLQLPRVLSRDLQLCWSACVGVS